jgi:hypothetical protein
MKPDTRTALAQGTETIDDRIKRLSRKFVSGMTPARETLLNLRNYCWAKSDEWAESGHQIDRELRKRQRTNPKWKRDRPKASQTRDYQVHLKSLIGRDAQKFELVEYLLTLTLALVNDPLTAEQMIEEASSSMNGKKLRDAVWVLSREKGGAPRKNDGVMPRAYELYVAGKKVDEIARECWPDAYRQNRARTKNRMKTALHRYRKSMTGLVKQKG